MAGLSRVVQDGLSVSRVAVAFPVLTVGAVGVAVAVLLVAVQWRLLIRVLLGNGQALVMLDEVEQLVQSGAGRVAGAVVKGLAVGSPAPPFALRDTDGQTITLDALRSRGKPVVLLFVEDGSEPCRRLLPEIARWQAEYADRVTVAVIARGDPQPAEMFAGTHRPRQILVEQDSGIFDDYGVWSVPAEAIVRPDGRIGGKVTTGAEPIRGLLASALRGSSAERPA